MSSSELSPKESRRRAAAVTDLLGKIENSSGDPNEWWNLTTYVELGGRTPTQAWLAGDHGLVEMLVEEWYRRSEAAAARHAKNPEFVAIIRERSNALADRSS